MIIIYKLKSEEIKKAISDYLFSELNLEARPEITEIEVKQKYNYLDVEAEITVDTNKPKEISTTASHTSEKVIDDNK